MKMWEKFNWQVWGLKQEKALFLVPILYHIKIKNGEINDLVKNITVSGNAFEVLKSVDAIANDWRLEMGNGHCGKWQAMKVDGGGATTRAIALVSGSVGGKN